MNTSRCDLIVIGSGPGGRRAAIQAAKLGKQVVVVEGSEHIGGAAAHTGTTPSKTLRATVLNLSGLREREFYGRGYRAKKEITAQDLLRRLQFTITHEVDVLEDQFARNQVQVAHGFAHFVDEHTIEVSSEHEEPARYQSDRIIIATGTKPYRPDNVAFDGKRIIDSDDIPHMESLPRSLTIVGGGVVGVEYATIFGALDMRVSLVDRHRDIITFVDREIVQYFCHQMRDMGIYLQFGSNVQSVAIENGQCMTRLSNGCGIRSEVVLYVAGRVGNTERLQLENCGLDADERGKISVNEHYQTSVPHIYAVGDVIGFPSLASTSLEQGRIAACHALSSNPNLKIRYFPYGIYSVPQISMVGMTEEEVQERNIPYECGNALFRETSRGQIMGNHGFLKAIFSLKTRRLLGVHIVGEGATELIHIGQAVINYKGKIDYFVENVFNYPTLAEAYKVAALDAWNRMNV